MSAFPLYFFIIAHQVCIHGYASPDKPAFLANNIYRFIKREYWNPVNMVIPAHYHGICPIMGFATGAFNHPFINGNSRFFGAIKDDSHCIRLIKQF